MSISEVSKQGKRGGRCENPGRKPICNNQDTCTIRVPKIYAQKVMQAHQLDSGESFDNITDFVAESKTDDLEKITQST